MIETEFPKAISWSNPFKKLKVTIKMLNYSNVKIYIWILALTQERGEADKKVFDCFHKSFNVGSQEEGKQDL